MRRKTSKLETRVWKFGCRPPSENAKLASDMLYAATVYKNRCIELKQQHLEEYRAVRAKHYPKLHALELRAEKIKQQLVDADEETTKQLKSKLKSFAKRLRKLRERADEALAAGDEEKKARVGECAPQIAKVRNPEVVEQMLREKKWSKWWKANAKLNLRDNTRRREARGQASGEEGVLKNHQGREVESMLHGTYDVCERAAEAAWKAYFRQLKDPTVKAETRAKMAKRGHPRFERHDGSGVLRVQMLESRYQISALPEPFGLTGRWLQIAVEPKRPWQPGPGRTPSTPGSKRQLRLAAQPGWGVARLRIRSGEKRAPIWISLPVYVHRRLPPDAQIKWASIVVKREGPRLRYELQLTCESATFGQLPAGAGVAAINFGWRSLGDGRYRIAYLVDESGHEEELVISPDPRQLVDGSTTEWSVPSRLRHADDLRRLMDVHFNEAKEVLSEWLDGREISEELQQRTEHLGLWRNHGKLERALKLLRVELQEDPDVCLQRWLQWKAERQVEGKDFFASSEEVFDWGLRHGIEDHDQAVLFYLDLWQRKHTHLYRWQTQQRRKAIAHRRHQVQCWMKRQAHKYSLILFEDYDLREVESACIKEKNEDRQTKRARKNRTFCAPGEARETLVRIAGKKTLGNTTEAEEGEGNSQICSACHLPCGNDLKSNLIVTCPHCGHVEDQDPRNCRNQLRRWREGPQASGGSPGRSSRSKERASEDQEAAVRERKKK